MRTMQHNHAVLHIQYTHAVLHIQYTHAVLHIQDTHAVLHTLLNLTDRTWRVCAMHRYIAVAVETGGN